MTLQELLVLDGWPLIVYSIIIVGLNYRDNSIYYPPNFFSSETVQKLESHIVQ